MKNITVRIGGIMGYISGFGTRCAALILGSAALLSLPVNSLSANQAAPVSAATIDISVTGLRSAKGDVLVCLSNNPKYFPDCTKDKAARKMKISAAKAGKVAINDVKPGTYAIAIVHDENANGKMDVSLFLPKEGFGFSRNPKIGMGPPKFKSAEFTVGKDDADYAVKMKYIL